MNILMALLGSFLLSLILVPMFKKIALKTGFVDHPNHRKKQQAAMPMLGGVAMIIGFLLIMLLTIQSFVSLKVWGGILTGIILISVIGLMDDYAKTRKKDFPALPKLLVQFLAGICLIKAGVMIYGINIPFGDIGYIYFPTVLSWVLTLTWIVGVINVFNFMDGLDGLAGGVATISALTLLFVALIVGEPTAALLAATLTGTSVGYLRYNFYPAKIFMGDTGSMFLGYILAAISLVGTMKTATVVSLFIPVLALGLPIFDGLYVVVKRLLSGKSAFSPDRTHAHHRLLHIGLNPRQTTLLLYLVSICFGMASLIVTLLNSR